MRKLPPNNYRRRELGPWSSTDADGMNGAFQIPIAHNTVANCIVSDGKDVDGTTMVFWEHVSVHVADRAGKQRTPSWEHMAKIKDIFWEPEEMVVQIHPPKSEYVNNHEHVLHLWKWTGGDFPRPDSILVGIKGIGVIK